MTGFGPTGKLVYDRTYSRVKPDGERETWPETVDRVVNGNLSLVDSRFEAPGERDDLAAMMRDFKIIPAGRHLWASGVKGRQYLFNCHVAGWGEDVTEHFSFTFLRLMEGGGVGANYSNWHLTKYPEVSGLMHDVHIVCDPEHPDYEKLKPYLSDEYDHEWAGALEVEDSREGWADALTDLIGTYFRDAEHVERVFDVSRVRGEGARLKTFGGRASGPLPLARMLGEVADILNNRVGDFLDGISAMEIDHSIATCVVSGGNRRSARMAMMHWADPQVMEFLHCKSDSGKHWTTNISVEVDEQFWVSAGKMSGHLARNVLDEIADGMRHNGEPGIWNSSYANVGEPNPVVCTNPCGEICLEEWENCNLGHVNLAGFVNPDGSVDIAGMEYAHELMTRFLIRATYGDVNDEKQAGVLARNRRVGVGHLGVASYLALTGIRYSEAPNVPIFENTLRLMRDAVDDSAAEYAHELRIPVPVKKRTVAPTGTIAKMPGVSEGIHPIFAKWFIRRIRFSNVDPDQMATVEEYRSAGYSVEPCLYAPETTVVSIPTKDSLMADVEDRFGHEEAKYLVQDADDLDMDHMLAFQAFYQWMWADNAVSYTVNIDADTYTAAEIASHLRFYGPSLKGATIFPEMGMPQSPYQRLTENEYQLYEMWQETQISDGVDENCVSGACPVK